MNICKCYRDEQNFLHERGVCYGTKDREPCSCVGNPAKCDFYEEVRKKYIHQKLRCTARKKASGKSSRFSLAKVVIKVI